MNKSNVLCKGQEKEGIRNIYLVSMSVFFAVFLEVLGVEAGLIYGRLSGESFFLILAVKVIFLTLICLPLVIYVVQNGLSALKSVWGRVTVVAIIVVINLAHNFLILGGKALGW